MSARARSSEDKEDLEALFDSIAAARAPVAAADTGPDMPAGAVISRIQDGLAADADALSMRWDSLLAAQPGVDEFKALVAATRDFLREVPGQARAANAQLAAVMLAHGSQDR